MSALSLADTPPSSAPPIDESLLEFLGADDVGDAAWWEFLKSRDARVEPPATPPPPPQPQPSTSQDARR